MSSETGSHPSLAPQVQRLHQILLWPLRLMPLPGADAAPALSILKTRACSHSRSRAASP